MKSSAQHIERIGERAARRQAAYVSLNTAKRVHSLLGYAPHGGYAKHQPHQGEREIARRKAQADRDTFAQAGRATAEFLSVGTLLSRRGRIIAA